MSGILGGKNRLICRNLPIDPDLRVIPCYCSLILRRIQIVALILENSLLGKDAESMCKPARHKKLTMIVLRQFHRNVFTKCRTSLSYIHRHIQNHPFDDPYKLALRILSLLEVQTTQHSVGTLAFIVLHETHRTYHSVKIPLGIRFKKITPAILENPRFNYHHSGNISLYYVHL